MKLTHTLMLAALAITVNGVWVATAADQKPAKEEKANSGAHGWRDGFNHDPDTDRDSGDPWAGEGIRAAQARGEGWPRNTAGKYSLAIK